MRATTEDDDDTHSPKSHIESRPYIPVGSFVIKWNKVAMIMSGFMKLKYCTLVGHMVERSVVTCSLGRACLCQVLILFPSELWQDLGSNSKSCKYLYYYSPLSPGRVVGW